MKTTTPELSIVLVNYKTPQLLLDCIASIASETADLSHEIIVVDNQSEDDSEQRVMAAFPQVVWINAGYNSGFARANNMGIKRAKGNYCLILNSDTIVKEHALKKTLVFFKQQETQRKLGLVGCKIVHFDGYTQYNSNTRSDLWRKTWRSNAFYKIIERLFNRQTHQQRKLAEQQRKAEEHTRIHETQWLGGAFLLFRTQLFQSKDLLLDEDFFMYCEDQEWCTRLKAHGYTHMFFPDAYILHAEGGSFAVKEGKYKQIALSEWLLVLKLYGKLGYLLFVFLQGINNASDAFFYFQANWRNKKSAEDERSKNERQWRAQIFKRYFSYILLHYSRKTSAALNYLKYGN